MSFFNKNGTAKTPQGDGRIWKNGGYAALLTAAVFVAVILLNLVVKALPSQYTNFDVTSNRMFTLSETTQTVLGTLEGEVTAYYLAETGNEDTNVTQLLDRYAGASSQFHWVQRDPVLYPALVQQYNGASSGSIVLLYGEKSEILEYPSLYEIDAAGYASGTYSYSFAAEKAITGSLAKLTRTSLAKFYALTGHGETALESDFAATLENAGMEREELNLLAVGEIPADCAVLYLGAPLSDLKQTEAAALGSYLEQGGTLLVSTALDVETPNLDAVLAEYGLARQPGLVVEDNSDYYAYRCPKTYLLPQIETNTVTAGMTQGMLVFAPLCHGILSAAEDESLTVTPLLTTSADSFAMVDYANAESAVQGPHDPSGSFAIAAAAEVEGRDTKIVWVGCPNVFLNQLNESVSGGNAQFFGSVVNWLNGESGLPVVEPRSMSAASLKVPTGAIVGYGLLFVGFLPLVCLAFGMAICLLRRRR